MAKVLARDENQRQWLVSALANNVLDIVLDVPLQRVAAVGEGRVVGSSDVQLVKVLQQQHTV